jgi:MoaA/NifB/PqqE/SkfB family radical SAM enzyme
MIHITAGGYVEPCPYSHFAADNIKDKPMEEILQSEFFGRLRGLIPQLDNPKMECMLFSHAGQVEEIAAETGGFRTEG